MVIVEVMFRILHIGRYAEVIQDTLNPFKSTIIQIISLIRNNVDPTDGAGQFCYKGSSYKSAIFCSPDQCPIAEKSLQELKDNHPE